MSLTTLPPIHPYNDAQSEEEDEEEIQPDTQQQLRTCGTCEGWKDGWMSLTTRPPIHPYNDAQSEEEDEEEIQPDTPYQLRTCGSREGWKDGWMCKVVLMFGCLIICVIVLFLTGGYRM